MLKTYFFIPANRHDFIANIDSIDADFFILDFEESVAIANKQESIDAFPPIVIKQNYYARPYFGNTNTIQTHFFEELIARGFRKFVLPKIDSILQLQIIADACGFNLEEISCILLVESPKCLLNLQQIIENSPLTIEGVALGSHDFAMAMHMEHTLPNLQFARQQVLCIARAYSIECIDIASMDIQASNIFIDECSQSVSLGFESKFTIHPKQLDAIKKIQWYTNEQVSEAYSIYSHIEKLDYNTFSVVSANGKLYEKPHIERFKKIIDWSRKYGNK